MSEFTPGSGGSMALTHTNVWANGVLIATDDVNKTHFYLNDWLGTRRVQTDDAGNLEQSCASLPYGDGETCGPGILYTGKERDSESGNDYFGARYYASTVGRWLSPDWANDAQDVPYGNFADPQTLNLYQYVENDPLGKVDPDGHGDAGVMDAAGGLVVVFPEVAPIIIGGAIGIELGNAIWDNRGAIERGLGNSMGFGGQYGDFSRTGPIVFKNSKASGGPKAAGKKGQPPQLQAGKDAHNNEEVRPGEKTEVRTADGKGRMDRYNESKRHIREIKPDNARGRRSGQKQLDRYKEAQDKTPGPPHTTELTLYPPKSK